MGGFGVELAFFTPVVHFSERNGVCPVTFAEQLVASVPLICENVENAVFTPHRFPTQFGNFPGFQILCDRGDSFPREEAVIDPPNHFCLFGDGNQLPAFFSAVAVGDLGDTERAVFHPHERPTAHILGDGDGLFLSECAHHAESHFVVKFPRVEVLLFKKDRNPQALQFPDRLNAVLAVPGKPRQGFHQYLVNLSGSAVRHKALEIVPLIRAGPGDALIGVDVHELPVGVGLDQLGIVLHLGGKRVALVVGIAADPAVSRHPYFLHLWPGQRLYHLDLGHGAPSFLGYLF